MVGIRMSEEPTQRGKNFFPTEAAEAPEKARDRIIEADERFQEAVRRAHPELIWLCVKMDTF